MFHLTTMPMSPNQKRREKREKIVVLEQWKSAYVCLCGKNMRNKSGNIHTVVIDKIMMSLTWG